MTSTARVEFDPRRFGVRVALMRDRGGDRRELIQWGDVTVRSYVVGESAGHSDDEGAWLPLEEEDARALYDALADHFGHAGHNTRALRKDYDAERKRVDLLIGNLIGKAVR